MGNKKKKYYVVWAGHKPGIYQTWTECETYTKGFPGAEYKSFKNLEEAQTAFQERELIDPQSRPDNDSYCVDAACSGNPGPLEYRGVNTATREEILKQGPFENGTNNIGEFLAIVHALALSMISSPEEYAVGAIPLIKRDSYESFSKKVYSTAIKIGNKDQKIHLKKEVEKQKIRIK